MSSSPINFESELINHSDIERDMNDNWHCNSQIPGLLIDDTYSSVTYSEMKKLNQEVARISINI